MDVRTSEVVEILDIVGLLIFFFTVVELQKITTF